MILSLKSPSVSVKTTSIHDKYHHHKKNVEL